VVPAPVAAPLFVLALLWDIPPAFVATVLSFVLAAAAPVPVPVCSLVPPAFWPLGLQPANAKAPAAQNTKIDFFMLNFFLSLLTCMWPY